MSSHVQPAIVKIILKIIVKMIMIKMINSWMLFAVYDHYQCIQSAFMMINDHD